MSSTRTVTRNVIWNSAGMLAMLLSGFVVAPYLVHHLGETKYGLWILIASLTSYFGNLDLGISGSVSRNLAFYIARRDDGNVRSILSTALAIMTGVAGLLLAGVPGILFLFFQLFDVPAADGDSVRLALILVCVNLALSFPLGLFDGTLWAMQRFDLQNAIDIPALALRTGATFLLIGAEQTSLVTLAWIVLATTLLQGGAKAIVSLWLEPALRPRLGAIRWQSVRTLYDYGIWFMLLTGTKTIAAQIGPTAVGARLGAAVVTPFRIGAQLAAYANQFMVQGTQVLTPVATALHAVNDGERQRKMLIVGGKACLILALFITGGFFLLGQALITLWVGAHYLDSWIYLLILTAGEILPMSQWISQSIILGSNRHKKLALYALAEIPVAVVLALLLVEPLGLAGVCLALAVPATLFRGLLQMTYACRLMNVGVPRYLLEAFLPALLFVVPHIALLSLAAAWHEPDSWLELFLYGITSSGLFFACFSVSLLGWQHVRGVVLGIVPPRRRAHAPPVLAGAAVEPGREKEVATS